MFLPDSKHICLVIYRIEIQVSLSYLTGTLVAMNRTKAIPDLIESTNKKLPGVRPSGGLVDFVIS